MFRKTKIRATGKLHGFECFTITVSYFTSSNINKFEYQFVTTMRKRYEYVIEVVKINKNRNQ